MDAVFFKVYILEQEIHLKSNGMIWFLKVDMNSKLTKLTINLVTFQKLSTLNFFSRCSLILTFLTLLSEDRKWFCSAETSLGVSWVSEAHALRELANRWQKGSQPAFQQSPFQLSHLRKIKIRPSPGEPPHPQKCLQLM